MPKSQQGSDNIQGRFRRPRQNCSFRGRINIYRSPDPVSGKNPERRFGDVSRNTHTYSSGRSSSGRLLKLEGVIRTLNRESRDEDSTGECTNMPGANYPWLARPIICVSDAVKRVVMERERSRQDRIVVIRTGSSPFPMSEGYGGKPGMGWAGEAPPRGRHGRDFNRS